MKQSAQSASPSSQPRTATNTSFESKRQARSKESQFVSKYGSKYHSYDQEKAPYPLSYDRHVLELEALDNRLIKHLRNGSNSFIDFSDHPPERCLDLGCGTGVWVIDAAKEWPSCEFVGFDLVNVQVPLKILEPSVANRITWTHGNFLTTKLPFEDDEFDHVHVQSIAKGVPENKWSQFFGEINRVLRPGGSLEIIEDDVVFPVLPLWFTSPLRSRPRRAMSMHFPDGTQRSAYPTPTDTQSDDLPSHDHALLEYLYSSVFEHRFINRKPSAVLPSYVTMYFTHVTLGPVICFPMPSLPPPQPLPQQQQRSRMSLFSVPNGTRDRAATSTSNASSTAVARPPSLSFSSILSGTTTNTNGTISFSDDSLLPERSRSLDSAYTSPAANEDHASIMQDSSRCQLYFLDNSLEESPIGKPGGSLLSIDRLDSLSERSLAMHLYRSYQSVLACQEALWEVLKDRIRNRRDELMEYGWEDDDEIAELQSRKKFEKLIERYRKDMEMRVALWCSLNNLGWPFPPRDELSKAEFIEEERVRQAMLEARKSAAPEELHETSRSIRVVTAYKPL